MLLKGKDNKIEEKRQEGGKGGWTGEELRIRESVGTVRRRVGG